MNRCGNSCPPASAARTSTTRTSQLLGVFALLEVRELFSDLRPHIAEDRALPGDERLRGGQCIGQEPGQLGIERVSDIRVERLGIADLGELCDVRLELLGRSC